MNVLFLSLMQYSTINERDIYTDLLREFIRNGHHVSILSPTEGSETLIAEGNSTIYRVPTGKIEKTSFLQKGINTILIEYRFIAAIKKHLSQVHFDLVLYPTPPITFVGAVKYVKERDRAKTYLMLKDIFPQNAVDWNYVGSRRERNHLSILLQERAPALCGFRPYWLHVSGKCGLYYRKPFRVKSS